MAITVRPASDVNSGSVADPAEYGDITQWWAATGVLDHPAGTELETTIVGGDYETKPGKALLRGHLFTSDATVTQTPTANANTSPRYDYVVARLHHQNLSDSTLPNGSITVVEGTAGGPVPAYSRDALGDWDTPLLLAAVTDTGAAVEEADPRVFMEPPAVAGLYRPAVQTPAEGQRFRDLITGFESLWTGGAWQPSGASTTLYKRVELAADQGIITFDGIPTTYQHLRIEVHAESVGAARSAWLRINGDSGTNYYSLLTVFSGDVNAPSRVVNAGNTVLYWGRVGTRSTSCTIKFNDYSVATDKSVAAWGHNAGLTTSEMENWIAGGLWNVTDPITSIEMQLDGGDQFLAGSSFSLIMER